MALVKISVSELEKFSFQKLSEEKLDQLIQDLGFCLDGFEEGKALVDVTPDRLDCVSVEGLGRAIASFTGKKTGLRHYAAKPSGFSISVDPSVSKVRPFIAGAIARNLEVNEPALLSLIDLQEKIHETFGRKRKKASVGIHNLDAVAPPFSYKAVKPESASFIPLDSSQEMNLLEIIEKHPKGIGYGHILAGKPLFPLVFDSKLNILSLPPIINAESTRVSQGAKNLFIEVTGTSLPAVNEVLNIVCCALADRGASIESVKAGRETTPDLSPRKASLSVESLNSLLGSSLSASRVAELLGRMGFRAKAGTGKVEVLVPCYRTDILAEADLIEDAAIALGYNSDELSPLLPDLATAGKPLHKPLEENSRSILAGLGFLETVTNTLSSPKANFEFVLLPRLPCCEILNPLTEEHSILRTHLLSSLLQVLQNGKSEKTPQRIFEAGLVFNAEGKESVHLAAAELDAQSSYSRIRSAAEALFSELGWKAEFKKTSHPSFIPGRVAEILLQGKRIGFLGEIHLQVLSNFGLEQPTAAFELRLE